MTPGQAAYEADLRRKPTYHDGSPRKPWANLPRWVQISWEEWKWPDTPDPEPEEAA